MNVYFTVDTESSLGGALGRADRLPLAAARLTFCRIGNEDYGIPLLVRILNEYGFRGTYFVETLSTQCLGDSDSKAVFDFLLHAEQDVQLHSHPAFHAYAEWQRAVSEGRDYRIPKPSDLIGRFDSAVQMELLSKAAYYFQRFAGYAPTAFRAGCYAASLTTLRCLRQLGITVDSSFNPCYHPDLSFPDTTLIPNLVQQVEGVWEIPVTVAKCQLREGYHGFKFADCTSLSFAEIRTMLDHAALAGQQHFVLVFHSFSAVKPKDETYSAMRPNRIVIRRLERLFRYLAENRDKFSG